MVAIYVPFINNGPCSFIESHPSSRGLYILNITHSYHPNWHQRVFHQNNMDPTLLFPMPSPLNFHGHIPVMPLCHHKSHHTIQQKKKPVIMPLKSVPFLHRSIWPYKGPQNILTHNIPTPVRRWPLGVCSRAFSPCYDYFLAKKDKNHRQPPTKSLCHCNNWIWESQIWRLSLSVESLSDRRL